MSEFGPEADAVCWLHDHFSADEGLRHLRARRRGRVVTIESGQPGDVVPHARFRRDTQHLWLLEMPGRGGRWESTPFRARLDELMSTLATQFPWTLMPVPADDSSDTSTNSGP